MNNFGNYWNGGKSFFINRNSPLIGNPKLPYPTAYYKFEDNTDSADNTGTEMVMLDPEYGPGLLGSCLVGGSGYSVIENFSSWTLCGWFKSVGFNASGFLGIISARRINGQLVYGATLKGDGLGGEYISFSNNINSPTYTGDNKTWYHICMSNNSGIISLYTNGKLVGTSTSSQLFAKIVVQSTNNTYKTYIDEVISFGESLTQVQVLRLYNEGLGFNPLN